MAIKGTLSRVATIGGSIVGAGAIRAKQVAIGTSGDTNISARSINELADVNVTESDDGLLSYDAATDKWVTTTTLDGGTF
jgi:hypothetical protein